MARRGFFFRLPATRPILLQGMTEPSLAMVTPEKPALQPDRVRSQPEGTLVSERVPVKGSPERTSKEGVFREKILW
jgi:hypothetical protein